MRSARPRWRWRWLIAGGGVLVLVLAIFSSRQSQKSLADTSSIGKESPNPLSNSINAERSRQLRRASSAAATAAQTPEQIVAAKVIQFGKSRRELVHAIAKRFNVEVPDDVERFFDAVERGDWEEINAAHAALLQPGAGLNDPRSPELHK